MNNSTTKFGAAGNCEEFYSAGNKSTVETAKFLKTKGLTAFEYSAGRGVNLGSETAKKIAESFRAENIEISIHAPYFINLANESEEMIEKSYKYIFDSIEAIGNLGGNRVIFHAATQGKLTRVKAMDIALKNMEELAGKVKSCGNSSLLLCPETMGKNGQLGTLDEIIEFVNISDIFMPTIDFGHLNARNQGGIKTEKDYMAILEKLVANCKRDVTNFHAHFSKIMYSKGGEVKHLTFEDNVYGPEFEPLAKCLKRLDLKPIIICESAGTQSKDAAEMMRIYNLT